MADEKLNTGPEVQKIEEAPRPLWLIRLTGRPPFPNTRRNRPGLPIPEMW